MDASTCSIPRGKLLRVELTIRDHWGLETRCVLHKLPFIIGRDGRADIQLMDPWISRRHCEIDQFGDVLVVRDLDSKNGSFIHGHRVSESNVLSGERLTLGRTEIVMHYLRGAHEAIEVAANEPRGIGPRKLNNFRTEPLVLVVNLEFGVKLPSEGLGDSKNHRFLGTAIGRLACGGHPHCAKQSLGEEDRDVRKQS